MANRVRAWGMAAGMLLTGCAAQPVLLIETPVVYHGGKVDPFAQLPPHRKSADTEVFYATTRAPENGGYGNRVASALHLGRADVRLGRPGMQWEDLHRASLSAQRQEPIPVEAGNPEETAQIPGEAGAVQKWTRAVQAALDESPKSEIMIYVHGTKVDFSNSCVLTAEIDHFAGRGFVGVGYAWPSHQHILDYLDRVDVHRAQRASTGLKNLIEILAAQTGARQINLICYSAGGRVTSKALDELRKEHPAESAAALKRKFRLGVVVFAAADVPVDVFDRRLLSASDLARKVVVTATDKDNALIAAHRIMGGKIRAGTEEAEEITEKLLHSTGRDNVELVDFSYGREERGFDIAGHHYWYRHPWASSEVLFLMRSNAPAHRRGLKAADGEGIWALGPEYPLEVVKAAMREW